MEMNNVWPTILAALPAIVVSIISIIVSLVQRRNEKRHARNAATSDSLKEKLTMFYYPYLLLEKENTALYKMFALEEKKNNPNFRTLVYLLSEKHNTLSENDKEILDVIINNDRRLLELINNNGQHIDSDSLRKDLSEMAVHYQLIVMAYSGKIQEPNGVQVYSKHVYPHNIQSKIEEEKARIEKRIKELEPCVKID